jgi:Tectonin domain/Subtilase family
MRQPVLSALLVASVMTLAGCGHGRRASAVPPTMSETTADATMRQWPVSVSPGRIPAAPMVRTPAQPAVPGRVTMSDISMLGWTQIPGSAREVAAATDGSLWVLSTQGTGTDYYIYRYLNGAWTNIPGAALRIAAAPDGTVWVVNSAGSIYHYDGHGWNPIAGGASDVSVGLDGSVYVISNQGGGPYGRGIWHYYAGSWSQLPGAAVRIAASWDAGSYPGSITPGGVYVVNALQTIYYYDWATGFHQLPGSAYQVAPTRSGGLFALGTAPPVGYGYPIYYRDLDASAWTQQAGSATSIATDGSRLYVANALGGIYFSPVSAHHIVGNGAPLSGPAKGPNNNGWGPRSVADALSFPVQSGFDGTGVTVAIVVNSAVLDNDVSAYLSYFQIPSTGRRIDSVIMPDASAIPTSDGQFEATLDAQTVAGLAPGANVRVYVTKDLSLQHITDAYAQAMSDARTAIVSSSFGGCEGSPASAQTGVNALITYAADSYIAFVASSGDWGNECYFNSTTFHQGVNWPGSHPQVIGIGGTETEPGYQLTSTTTWNDSFAFSGQLATGGGVSTQFTLPLYQLGLSGAASSAFRNVPDIAMPAVDDAIYLNGGWQRAVGTSWSAPMFAAMLAEVYQYCNAIFYEPVHLPYYVWQQAGNGAFIDTTSGDNRFHGTMPFYTAHAGYDNTTGFGVPLGMPFAQTLCPNRVPAARTRRPASVASLPARPPAAPLAADVVPSTIGLTDRGARPAAATTRIQLVLRPSATVASDEQTVTSVLKAAGFRIVRTFGNHLVVDAEGPTAGVETLFSTRLHDVVQDGHGARYMPVTAAVIPASLAPYVAGVSLDDVVTLKHV